MGRSLVARNEEGETADPGKDLRDGCVFVNVVPVVPDRNFGVLGESGEPRQVVVLLECAVDVVRVIENVINDVDIEVLVAALLQDLWPWVVVGSAFQNNVKQRKARKV